MASLYGDPNTGFLQAGQYPGSSGYWATDPTYGPSGGMRNGLYPGDAARLAMGQTPLAPGAERIIGDEPVWDSVNGIWINPRTKKPYSGRKRDGTYVVNGISHGQNNPASFTQPNINPNDPNQRYKPVEITKAPDISAATKDLVKQFKDTAEQSLKGFDDHLKAFTSGVSDANKATQSAITAAVPTANTLSRQQEAFSKSLAAASADYSKVNADTAAKEKGLVDEAKGLLPEYDAAAQAIADRQMQEVTKNLSRYKLSTGTPMSAGSDESRILASAAADVMLPLKQAEINRRYDIISGLEVPTTQDIANRQTAKVSQFDPMVAGQTYQSGQATTQQVQALKEHVAGMSFDNAERTLRDMGIPSQVINTILGGNISNLSGLAGLEEGANYRGLQDLLGANLSQPIYYDQSVPGYPVPSRYSPTRPGNTPSVQPALGPNAPVQVGPGNPQQQNRQPNAVDIAYKQQTGFFPWEDRYFNPDAYNNLYNQLFSRNPGPSATPNSSAPPQTYPVSTSGAGDYNEPDGVYA